MELPVDEKDESLADSEESPSDPEVVPDGLPSIGSLKHSIGECKRCNFYPKGRCQNGYDCQFCHLPHEKRKPSRQEKRERRAAWLSANGGEDVDREMDDDSEDGDEPEAVEQE